MHIIAHYAHYAHSAIRQSLKKNVISQTDICIITNFCVSLHHQRIAQVGNCG